MFGDLEHATHLADRWLGFFRLDPASSASEFLTNGAAACILHDIGKANTGFQAAVRGQPGAQAIYHEHLSALILSHTANDRWFHGIRNLDRGIVTASIVGHHLRVDHESFALSPPNSGAKAFQLKTTALYEILNAFAGWFGSEPSFLTGLDESWSVSSPQFDIVSEDFRRQQHNLKRELWQNPHRHQLLMAVRAALILADSAGSGLLRENKPLKKWLDESFDPGALIGGDGVDRKVIAPRIEYLKQKHRWTGWYDFQLAADKLPERTLLLAPCASGKTLAAWRWISAQAARRPIARVIFLYPTRGTATEGFRDYISWAPEADAALVHGTSEYELGGMFENVQDDRRQKNFTTEDRLFALAYWQRRIFSATVDQFLGFMQHSYRSTCLMPLLADSVVVIDEVHSFDKSLFSSLKAFLREFNVPALCMTASLPKQRIADLKDCGLAVFPDDVNQFKDLQNSATMPRYSVACLKDAAEAEAAARQARDQGKRVLWVVNTVDRCQTLARRLDALCYHGRFKLDDRKERHKKAVDAFKPDGAAVIAITTQVCEMSLDLDAQVLISETAPVTSMIQRMGRCNRHTQPKDERLGQVNLYRPEDARPYRAEDMTGANEFVAAISGRDVSQARLQELLEQFGPKEVEVDRYAAFVESGPWAMSREEPLRDIDEFTVEAILDSDVAEYRRRRNEDKPKPVDGLIVPVPRKSAVPDSRVESWRRVAPASHYDPLWGFMKEANGKGKAED
jgi:CRISPR-associated endonuclease/helicase Cas3